MLLVGKKICKCARDLWTESIRENSFSPNPNIKSNLPTKKSEENPAKFRA